MTGSKNEANRNVKQNSFVQQLFKTSNRPYRGSKSKKRMRKTKKKSVRDREVHATGQQIRVVLNKSNSSQMMSELRSLEYEGKLKMQNFVPYKMLNTYDSIKYNFNQDLKPCTRTWYDEVRWGVMISEIQNWIETYMTEEVQKPLDDYKDNVMKFHLSHFIPKLLIEGILKFGINDGLWSESMSRKFREICETWVNNFVWSDEDPKQLVDNRDLFPKSLEGYTSAQQEEIWYDMIKVYEPVKLLSNQSTSAYPDFEKQSVAYHIEHAAQAVIDGPSGYIVVYHRRHGKKQKIIDNQVLSVVKVRPVFGVDYPSKVYGLPLTHSFKLTKPKKSAYYQSWFDLFIRGLDNFLNANFTFTADQSEHDMRQNRIQMLIQKEVISENMPDWMKEYYLKLFEKTYEDPKLIVMLKKFIQLGRTISASGSPPTPLQESMSTDAYLSLGLEDQKITIDDKIIQIDDSMFFCDDEVDMEKLSLFMRKEFGAIMTPEKTENSINGFVTFLQVLLGYIYKRAKFDDLQFLTELIDRVIDKGVGILGVVWRRIHRMMFAERQGAKVSPFSGDVIFFNEDTNQSAPVDVQRILGLIGSFGPWIPIGLLNIVVTHLERTKFWKEQVMVFLSEAPASKTGDWGFDGNHIIRHLRRRYKYE